MNEMYVKYLFPVSQVSKTITINKLFKGITLTTITTTTTNLNQVLVWHKLKKNVFIAVKQKIFKRLLSWCPDQDILIALRTRSLFLHRPWLITLSNCWWLASILMGALTGLSIHSSVCLFWQRTGRSFLDRVRWVSLIAALLLKPRQRI